MIQTANDVPKRDPKNWTLEDENGKVVHTVVDEKERGRFVAKQYTIEGDGAWCKTIKLKVSDSRTDACQLSRF